MKIGRNEPCPCKSGRKFKKCCGSVTAQQRYAEIIQAQRQRRVVREHKFGKVKDIVHANFKGAKFVAVGRELMVSSERRPWKTFTDFSIDYLKRLMGKDWWLAEAKKPVAERHEIVQLAFFFEENGRRFGTPEGGIIRAEADGASLEFVSVAYDIYLLRHHQLCQRRLLQRLRDPIQYPGARIELAAAAAFLRAGFDLQMEDEGKGGKKHPEFIATHRMTREVVAVEAKRRHREQQSTNQALGVASLVKSAFQKIGDQPFALYLELNAPPLVGEVPANAPWMDELNDALDARGIGRNESGMDRFSIVFATNRWMRPGEKPVFQYVTIIPVRSERPISGSTSGKLRRALQQTLNIPNHFEDSEL